MKHFTSFLLMFITYIIAAQEAQDYGGLRGAIIEGFSQEPIQHAYLSLQLNGALVAQTRADANGVYLFIDVEVGSYDLIISKLGLSPLKITNVFIVANEIAELNPVFEARGFDQDTVVFTSSEFRQKGFKSKHLHRSKKQATKRQRRAAKKLERQLIP